MNHILAFGDFPPGEVKHQPSKSVGKVFLGGRWVTEHVPCLLRNVHLNPGKKSVGGNREYFRQGSFKGPITGKPWGTGETRRRT